MINRVIAVCSLRICQEKEHKQTHIHYGLRWNRIGFHTTAQRKDKTDISVQT